MVKNKRPIIIIEVKKFMSKMYRDVIKLLIYFQYMMRRYKISSILGSLTDSQTWHTTKIDLLKDLP